MSSIFSIEGNAPKGKSKKSLELDKTEYFSLEVVDNRTIALIRVLLAFLALIVTAIAPASPDRLIEITYLTLIAYCLYSVLLYIFSFKNVTIIPFHLRHWIDTGWYLVLVSLSGGTNSIFFFFFFFSILIAAFRWGFNSGLRVVIVSAILFTVIGFAAAPHDQEFELNLFLLRPAYLLLIGYLICYWGGQIVKLKRRLALHKDANKLSNPRFGIDQTIDTMLKRLRDFYDADQCLLITGISSPPYIWREVNRDAADEDLKVERTEAAKPLINLPDKTAVFYQSNRKSWYRSAKQSAFDVSTGKYVETKQINCAALADLLEAESFLSVPLIQRETPFGRLYLISQGNCFERSDMEFISQLAEHVLPALENVELLDRLATEAAGRQREKISRDIHDSTIQPYIGLKLGLEALVIKCASGRQINEDVAKLIRLADSSIAELRGYVGKLKGESGEESGKVLISAVKRQALKFQEFYNVEVNVEAADGFYMNDRLAAEAFQIVSEGLSNIRRHTKSKRATIGIRREAELLVLEIKNDNDGTVRAGEFLPKSIASRAESLGGRAHIETLESHTRVLVKIPL